MGRKQHGTGGGKRWQLATSNTEDRLFKSKPARSSGPSKTLAKTLLSCRFFRLPEKEKDANANVNLSLQRVVPCLARTVCLSACLSLLHLSGISA